MSQESYIIWFSFMVLHLWYSCVKWQYFQDFFSFFQNFDFLCCWRGKRAKNSPKWQKILSCLISQVLSFVVHKCKMIISPAICFISSKFWFVGLLGGSKGKKWQKTLSFALYIPGTLHDLILIYGIYTCVKG